MYAPHLTSYLSGRPMNCEWYLHCFKIHGNDEILEFEVSETWTFLLFICQILGLEDANSTEFDSATPHPCVVFMPEVSLILSAPVSGSSKKDVVSGHYLYQAAILRSPNPWAAGVLPLYTCIRHKFSYICNEDKIGSILFQEMKL